jgi:hypothetical protein
MNENELAKNYRLLVAQMISVSVADVWRARKPRKTKWGIIDAAARDAEAFLKSDTLDMYCSAAGFSPTLPAIVRRAVDTETMHDMHLGKRCFDVVANQRAADKRGATNRRKLQEVA